MASKYYMVVDERRDHSFRVPRPDLSVETGAPDACTDCHGERDAAWAAAEIARRFPDSARRGVHFSTTFAAASARPSIPPPGIAEGRPPRRENAPGHRSPRRDRPEAGYGPPALGAAP